MRLLPIPLITAVALTSCSMRDQVVTPSGVGAVVRATLDGPQTVEGVGAAQGLEWRDGKVYLIGDAAAGVMREYTVEGDTTLKYTGREVRLTVGGQDRLPHPTGLTSHPTLGTFLGNTVAGKGNVCLLDWGKALAQGTLDGAILNETQDDAAVNGTRPEFVRLGPAWYVATSDYGPVGNQVRLYDPVRLASAAKTSEPGVLAHLFSCGPWVQSLHWIGERGLLALVQNRVEGRGWRITLVDLQGSVDKGTAQVVQTLDLAPPDELEGFHLIGPDRGIMVTSSQTDNVVFATLDWRAD